MMVDLTWQGIRVIDPSSTIEIVVGILHKSEEQSSSLLKKKNVLPIPSSFSFSGGGPDNYFWEWRN